jgi:SAM-dependent methyltransferase
MPTARYDGQTAWYEEIASAEGVSSARASAVQMLGSGPGRCLDLGCGTGRAIPALRDAGWSVVGTDISVDQLEAARQRTGEPAENLVRADAHALPFEDGEFDAVISIFTHTDLDDVVSAFTEACRVVRKGGVFIYLGAHPCFGSPFVERGRGGSPPILHAGYRSAGWQRLEGDENSPKIRVRVGINHLPLAGLVNAIVQSGFTIKQFEEPGDEDPPLFLGIKSLKL